MSRSEELRITAGEATLAGTLLLPDDPPPAERRGRYPNALLLGSWLPRDRDGGPDRVAHASWYAAPAPAEPPGLLARLGEALAERGVASLRYDPRGCGISQGRWEAAPLFTRIDDARDALGHLRSRRDLDLARTGLVGHGEGAAVAMSVAIGDPAVGALTLIGATARSFRDVLRRAVAERSRRPAARHPILVALDRTAEEIIERADRHERSMSLTVAGERIELELSGWQQAFAMPPIALATMLHRSVSFIHGADDAWAGVDEARLLETVLRAGGNQPTLRVIEGADHDLAEAADSVIDAIAADLAGRLEPRQLPPVLLAIEENE